MWFEAKWLLRVVIAEAALGGACLLFGQERTPDVQKRPVTVADAIGMTRIAGTGYPAVRPRSGFAVFSPDGRRFAIVLSRGNMRQNTNDYSLLLFRSGDVFKTPVPRLLASFSSSSNREGIFNLSWRKDSDTLLFLGARENEATQLYSVQCSSGELKRLTNHHTSLVSYAVSREGDRVVYATERPDTPVVDENALRYGIHVTTESLGDLIAGQTKNYEPELFLKAIGDITEKHLQTRDPFDSGVNDLFLSPNGRYLVVKTDSTQLPESWRRYEDSSIQTAFRQKLPNGFPTRVLHYELINTRTGTSETLLDSPATYSSSDVVWSPDSKSLLLCGVFLPLNVDDPMELKSRQSTKFVVEISLPSLAIVKIASEDLRSGNWDPQTNIVQFQIRHKHVKTGDAPESVYYRKTGKAWERLSNALALASDSRPDIRAEQNLNLPPRIVAVNPKTKQIRTVLDLNPRFSGLALGKVEEINWKDATGNLVRGGLYLPPDFSTGVRYPLVIQTHGFDPQGFSIDGPHITASAAQPLASKGIVVLQLNDIFYDSLVSPQEPERAMSAYENAIQLLDEKGIIDRNRVGLAGFSRTCLYVKYALTHSQTHFAAAIASDGVDAGYLQYLIFSNASPRSASEVDTIIGTPPFGPGLSVWLKRSPGFMLDRVQTPLQLQAIGGSSLLAEWEWYSGLRRLNKPVELVYLPAGTHVLVKPWDRLVSQGGAVDWFCFWLKGEEDPDPAKSEQYARWRELRKLGGSKSGVASSRAERGQIAYAETK